MSLPVSRRIARAALLIAAGAAPVVAAAGSAEAVALPQAPGGLTALDSTSAGQTVKNAAMTGAGVVSNVGEQATETFTPEAAAAAKVAKKAAMKQAKHVAHGVAKKHITTDPTPEGAARGLAEDLVGHLIGGVPIGTNSTGMNGMTVVR